MIKRLPISTTNRALTCLLHWNQEDVLLLSPPYQRGDVWGPIRRSNLLFSIFTGIPIPSLIINDRWNAGWHSSIDGKMYAVIDGKQRITTILDFFRDALSIPGEWVGSKEKEVFFSELSPVIQRGMKNYSIGISEAQLKTLEDEKKVFELVNFGGVPQGESDFIV